MATKELGQVGIRARPLTSGFRQELLKELRRVERDPRIHVTVDAELEDGLRVKAKAAAEEASGETVEFDVDVDDRDARRTMARLQSYLEDVAAGQHVLVDAELDRKKLAGDMAVLRRELQDMQAKITPVIDRVQEDYLAVEHARLKLEIDRESVLEVYRQVEEIRRNLESDSVLLDVDLEDTFGDRLRRKLEESVNRGLGTARLRMPRVQFEPSSVDIDTSRIRDTQIDLDAGVRVRAEAQPTVTIDRDTMAKLRDDVAQAIDRLDAQRAPMVMPLTLRPEVEKARKELRRFLAEHIEARVNVGVDANDALNALNRIAEYSALFDELSLGDGWGADTESIMAGLEESLRKVREAGVTVDGDVDLDTSKAMLKLQALRVFLRSEWAASDLRLRTIDATRQLREFIASTGQERVVVPVVARTREAAAKFREFIASTLRDRETGLPLPVVVQTTRATQAVREFVTRARAQLRGFQVPVVARTGEAFRAVRDFVGRARVMMRSLTGSVEVDTGKAARETLTAREELQALLRARPLDATIRVKVAEASLAKAKATLAALSGGNIFKRISTDIGEMVENLDDVALAIGKFGLIGGTAANVVLGALGSVTTVAGDVAQGLGVLGAAPAFLAAAAIQAGVLAAALRDVGARLGDLRPVFSGLQDTISSNFWAGAEEPIRRLVQSQLPALQAGFGGVADAMGRSFGSFADTLNRALSGRLDGMFRNLVAGIDASRAGTDALAHSVGVLGTVGSKYLPQFGAWFSKLATQFDGFLSKAEADGRLQGWIDAGIKSLQDLGRVFGETARIVAEFYQLTAQSGFAGLGNLANGLKSIRQIMQSPEFQGGALNILGGAHEGITLMNQGLGDLFGSLGGLNVQIGQMLTNVGASVGALGTLLGNVFANPVFAQGLTDAFTGLRAGMEALIPLGDGLGETFGLLGTVAGTLFSSMGAELGQFADLGLIVNQVLGELPPIVESLVGGLGGGLQALMGPLQTVVNAILPPLSSGLQTLGPLFESIATTISSFGVPAIAGLAGAMSLSLLPALKNIPLLGGAIDGLLTKLPLLSSPWLAAAVGVGAFLAAASPSDFSAMTDAVTGMVDQFIDALPAFIDSGVKMITGLVDNIVENLPLLLDAATQILTALIEGLVTALPMLVQGAVTLVQGLLQGIVQNLPMIVQAAVTLVTTLVQGLTQALPLIVQGVLQLLTGLIQAIVDNLPMIVQAAIQLVTSLVQGLIQALPMIIEATIQLVTALLNGIADNLPLIIEAGVTLLISLVNGIIEALPELISAALELIPVVVQTLLDNLPQLVGAALEIIVALAGGLVQAIPQLVAEIPKIVTEMINAFLNTDWLGLGGDIIAGIVQGLVNAGGQILDAILQVIKDAWGAVLGFFGIHSPSTLARDQVGKQIPAGIAVGIRQGGVKAVTAADAMSRDIASAVVTPPIRPAVVDPDLTGSPLLNGASQWPSLTINQEINAPDGASVETVADLAVSRVKSQFVGVS